MSLLWASIQREAMPWDQRDKGFVHTPVPVRDAGFKGLVLPSPEEHEEIHGEPPPYARSTHEHLQHHFDEDLYEKSAPPIEPHHLDEHGDTTDEYHEEHGEAYAKAVQHKIDHEERPDHHDDDLHAFVGEHIDNPKVWKPERIDLSKGVYATQTHVSKEHIERYDRDPSGPVWSQVKHGPSKWDDDYVANKAPVFVTHEGRLHAVEGHHRVAQALRSGQTHIGGYHYDADKHGWPARRDED